MGAGGNCVDMCAMKRNYVANSVCVCVYIYKYIRLKIAQKHTDSHTHTLLMESMGSHQIRASHLVHLCT